MGATDQPHASWLGLLKHGIRHLAQKQFQPQWGIELEASLDAGFSPFHLETALRHAELVEEALNMPNEKAFAQWLESAFANFKTLNEEKAKAPLEVLRDLHEAGALLLTTNYDSLLTDITGVPPVTWEEHADFHRVMTRQKAGILHIHGHWERPSSIVLGRTSYNRVVADEDLQQLFRALWLDWTWVYVGCGDGLDDPNLGRLLEWGRRWGVSALPDFFLAREDKAKEIANRPDKPPNLVSIDYPSHEGLPMVLRSITPAARCGPLVRVDDEFPLFRVPGSNIPFPTRQEYLDGDVPTLAADAELQKRLQTHGWACVIDVASVGKTTLALRSASNAGTARTPGLLPRPQRRRFWTTMRPARPRLSIAFDEPQLEFASGQMLEHPRDGLTLFGPVDSKGIEKPSHLCYGVVGTKVGVRAFREFVRAANRPIPTDNDLDEVLWPHFPGFEEAFHAVLPTQPAWVEELDEAVVVNAANNRDDHQRVFGVVSSSSAG